MTGKRAPVSATVCPVCGTAAVAPPAFASKDVPVLLNVLVPDRETARAVPRAELELHECVACGFCWNAAFEEVPYDARYLVDPTRSDRYRAHLDWVADRVASLATGPITLLEVGAGQGHFLAHFAARHGARLRSAVGFDPAYRHGEVILPERVRVVARPFDSSSSSSLGERPNVVVARHLIEHLPEPVDFLAELRAQLVGDAPFVVALETPHVGHTLAHGLLHDFCYEHCSMFSETALRLSLELAGFAEVDVDVDAFGGEYAFATALSDPTREYERASAVVSRVAGRRGRLAELGATFVPRHRARIERARTRGPVVVWGAAGKGALFAQFVDPDATLIDAVVDIHPAKQGHHLPGAGHLVIAPERARELGARTVVVANRTYADEVAAECVRLGLGADVFCVGDVEDEPG